MELQDLNHWWQVGKVKKELAPDIHRDLFESIKGDLARKQLQIIVGLRRTGKSTILFQIIDHLISTGIKPLNILYCSFDEPELQEKRLEIILKDYSKIAGIDYKKEKIFLIVDEVQKGNEWVADIKLTYDNLKNIKILISGSAAINILSEARKSLAGRSIYYELKPLSFSEFLLFKDIKIAKKSILVHKDLLEEEFKNYLSRPFPDLVHEKDINFIKNYIRNSIIDPIVLKDIPKEFKGVDILLIEKLVTIFLSDPGEYLKVDEIASELGRAKATLYKAIFYLEFSFLTKRILNFRPSIRAASRKMSKIYPYHPALSTPFNISESRYAENLVMFELDAKYYWREKEKEIDFLNDSDLIEVKFSSNIDKNDTRWISYFQKKYSKTSRKAYIITKDSSGNIGDVKLIPLWQFCLKGIE